MDLCFVFVVEPASGLVASFHAYVVAGNQSSEDGLGFASSHAFLFPVFVLSGRLAGRQGKTSTA